MTTQDDQQSQESTRNVGSLMRDTANALDDALKQMQAAAEFPSTEEIENARLKIQNAIGNGMLEAEATGKKLLVVLGETHISRDNILLEGMAVKAAHNLGIQNAAIELPADAVAMVEKAIDFRKPVIMPTQVTIPLIRDVYKMNMAYVDNIPGPKLSTENLNALVPNIFTNEANEFRENHMFAEIAKMPGHALVITGNFHVPGFLQSEQLKKDYVVVALDLDNKDYPGLKASDATIAARIEYMNSRPKDVTTVTFAGDAREKPLWECIEIGVGKEDADKLKNTLMEKGILYTDAEIASRIERLTNGANAFPNDPEIRHQRGMLNAVANNYLDASQDYLMAIVLSPEDKKGFYRAHYTVFMDSIPPSAKDRILGNATPSFATAGMPTSGFTNPLRLSTIPSNLAEISPALNEHIWNGGVSTFIESGKATFPQIDEIFKRNPEALNALRHKNFIDAVNDGYITVEQVGKISEFDLGKLKSKASGVKLREEVEKLIGTELSPPMPANQPKPAPDDLIRPLSLADKPAA